MATIHMLIGIPGSGKSTYCKNTLTKNYSHAIFIASDKVRDANPHLKEEEIWPEIYRLCVNALNNDTDIIYDATNITPTVRNRFKNKLAELNVKEYDMIAYYFTTNPKICYERVLLRNTFPNERFLPAEVVLSYGEKIIAPTLDEGFKEIITINNDEHKTDY